jgi:hypothetical protein
MPNVRDDHDTPLWGPGWGKLVALICPTRPAKYFFQQVWTGQITLKLQRKIGSARTAFQGRKQSSCDGVGCSRCVIEKRIDDGEARDGAAMLHVFAIEGVASRLDGGDDDQCIVER